MGPLMLDVQGLTLSKEEQKQLANPLVGGLILFSRNFETVEQLNGLIKQIRLAAEGELIIAVDHEGGRVQRFKQGFTHIPAMGDILPFYNNDVDSASKACTELGWLMAAELIALDIDISFAPVLDLDVCSTVIGDRAFSDDPKIVSELGGAFIEGMRQAGMACTGKHFPGHGSVVADSHIDIPVDKREQSAINNIDKVVFDQLINQQQIDALMPAHVIYPAFCEQPAGFSTFWLQQVLRQSLAFDGVIFSDDLGMAGATVAGNFAQRTEAALRAGCDMVLSCNNPEGTVQILTYLETNYTHVVTQQEQDNSARRLRSMLRKDSDGSSTTDATRMKHAVELAAAIHAGK